MKGSVTKRRMRKQVQGNLKGALKRLRHGRPGLHYTLAHMGILTAIPHIWYNTFIMRVIMFLNRFFFTGIPFELLGTQFPLGEKNYFPLFQQTFSATWYTKYFKFLGAKRQDIELKVFTFSLAFKFLKNVQTLICVK